MNTRNYTALQFSVGPFSGSSFDSDRVIAIGLNDHRCGAVAILKPGPVSRLLRRDVEGRGERARRVWGRIMAHWTDQQIRRDVFVDYVMGPACWSLNFGATKYGEAENGAMGKGETWSSSSVLSSTSGPSSFLLNG